MKRCPQCNRIATNDLLLFCRHDGVRLVSDRDSFIDSQTVALLPEATELTTSASEASATPPTVRVDLANGKTFRLGRRMQKRTIGVSVVASIIVLTLTGSVYYSLSRKSKPAINSMAVLPFINVNADQQLDYLTDGMTETLIYNLSQLPELNVKAFSSVFRYKGKEVTPHTVGADLNVQAILNGRILQRGDVLTLNLEMADTHTENVIWNAQYSRKQDELVSLLSEIARDISSKLRVKLARTDEEKLSKKYTANVEAYQLYLKGRYYWNKRTAKDLDRGIECFNQAISLDPNYALAYAGLADSYVSRYNFVIFLTALGEKDKAFDEPDKSYEVFGRLLRIDPLLDSLRDAPRFEDILRRAGLF